MRNTGFFRVVFSGREGRFIAAILLAALIYALSWSGFFIRPVEMSMTADKTVLVRKTPMGAVNADWIMDATAVDGTECSARGSAIFQAKPNNIARFATHDTIVPCLGLLTVVDTSWTVRLLGIPMRPVRLTTILETWP